MPPKRLTANPTAPLRYRPGKAVGAAESSSSSESDSDSESDTQSKPKPTASKPPPATSFPKFNTAEAEARKRAAAAAAAAAASEPPSAAVADDGFITASDSEPSDAAASESESADNEDAASSESSSEEDSSAPKFVAPKFIPKAKRGTLVLQHQPSTGAAASSSSSSPSLRRQKADELLEAQLKRDAAAQAARRKAFDDDGDDNGDADASRGDADDTDGLDPEAERAAWRLRELTRLKRDRDALVAADRAREERDAYRAMTAEERAAVDAEKSARLEGERGARGQAGFMARYHHKGAFFQAAGEGEGEGRGGELDAMLEELRRRDLMGAKFQDDSAREMLPEYMQIRDMTRLGRKGRTKYKDLRNEDTGTWGREERRPYAAGQDGYGAPREDDGGPTGANSFAVGERRPRGPGEQADDRAEKRSRFT